MKSSGEGAVNQLDQRPHHGRIVGMPSSEMVSEGTASSCFVASDKWRHPLSCCTVAVSMLVRVVMDAATPLHSAPHETLGTVLFVLLADGVRSDRKNRPHCLPDLVLPAITQFCVRFSSILGQ